MDNSNVSSSGQNDPKEEVQQQVQAPVVPSVPASPPLQQGGPVGSVHKEFGPTAVSTHEIMQPAGEHVEPQLAPEVREVGVQAVKEVPDLTLHDKKSGIQVAKESTPHPTGPTGVVNYVMSEEEAKEEVKHKDVSRSWYWAAVAVLKQIHKKLIKA